MKHFKKAILIATGSVVGSSFAETTTGTDYSTLTGAVDFSTAITAILVVAAALAGVYVAFKGAKLIMSAIKGG